MNASEGIMDLRSFLDDSSWPVFAPGEPLSTVQEITALQHAVAELGRQPIIRVDRPIMSDGSHSPIPVVTNLFASRQVVARLLGIPDHRHAARDLPARAAQSAAPVVVSDAPVQEIVLEGDAASVLDLPVLTQHTLDLAPYLTAAHIVTVDPDTNIDNTSIQRCCVREPRFMTAHVSRVSHNGLNVKKWWARGEDCPVAIWIGHHPAIMAGAQAKCGYPESHWPAAGGLAGTAIRLTPTLTHGSRILVPADAEIVIEGFIPKDRWEADGPLGEYHGNVGLQIPCVAIQVERITRRRDAIYCDCGAGIHDHLIQENMAVEAGVFASTKSVAPSLINVHLPYSGRRFNVYLQFKDPRPGEVRDALLAVMAKRRHRTVIAVDEDVDIFDDSEMMWALATRVQWHRDMITVDGLTKPAHDPSLPPGARTITKAGIDATLPPAPGRGLPKPVAPRLSVSDAALSRARQLLEGRDPSGWPTS